MKIAGELKKSFFIALWFILLTFPIMVIRVNTIEQVVVYQNRDLNQFPAEALQQLNQGELDWIGLSSPSIARNIARLLTPEAKAHLGTKTKLASISPVTSAAAREAGLSIDAEALEYTWNGLFDAMATKNGAGKCQPRDSTT